MDGLLKLSFSSDEIEDVIGAWMNELKKSKEIKLSLITLVIIGHINFIKSAFHM